jgi:hypothetical protein
LGFYCLSATSFFFISFVHLLELLTPALVKARTFMRAHKSPVFIGLDTLHEEIGNPESVEKITSTVFLSSIVLAELKELNNISVPRLKVNSKGSLTFATSLIDVASSVSENTEHGYKSVGVSISSSDVGGGKRKGAFAVYLEPWHADVVEFLQLRKNNGTEENRARDLFYALWIPDLFMKRV